MPVTTLQGIFIVATTAILGSAIVRRMRRPVSRDCLAGIYSSGPEPLRDDIVAELKPAGKAATEGKPYYLTPTAQANAFMALAKAYTEQWWPRSLAIRKVLLQLAPGCNWYADQDTDFTPEQFFVWQSMWTLAAVVEADMGQNRHVAPKGNNLLTREELGLPLGPNGEKPVDSYAVFVASDPEGTHVEEVTVLARDWSMQDGTVVQDYQVMGYQQNGKWVQPSFYKHHGYNTGDPIKLANAYTLI